MQCVVKKNEIVNFLDKQQCIGSKDNSSEGSVVSSQLSIGSRPSFETLERTPHSKVSKLGRAL